MDISKHVNLNDHSGLIPADVAKKASELGLLPQLHEYSTMNAQRRRDVYPQVLSLAKALGTSTENVKMSLQWEGVIFDPDEVRQQQAALAAERRAARSDAERDLVVWAERAFAERAAAKRAAAYNVVITCRYYIDELDKVEEELERVKEENVRLEKENAQLIELLPGRGGSRKRKATRRKRH
jgi:hypothetical protein